MAMLNWFTTILFTFLLAWGVPFLFKKKYLGLILVILVSAFWILWTIGFSKYVVGFALTDPLRTRQLVWIIFLTIITVAIIWSSDHQKKKQKELESANKLLNQSLVELSDEFNCYLTENLTSNTIIKGAKDHRSELFRQLASTKESLIILSGWANNYGIDPLIKQKITQLLDNQIFLTLGWGYKTKRDSSINSEFSELETWLLEKTKDYPNLDILYFRNHSKAIIRDGEEAVIGSFNWLSNNGKSQNDEMSLVISDRDTITKLRNSISTKRI